MCGHVINRWSKIDANHRYPLDCSIKRIKNCRVIQSLAEDVRSRNGSFENKSRVPQVYRGRVAVVASALMKDIRGARSRHEQELNFNEIHTDLQRFWIAIQTPSS